MPVLYQTVPVTDLAANCYIVWDEHTKEAVVIDPGGEAETIGTFIETQALKVSLILNTHGHADHTNHNVKLRNATGAPIAIHPADAAMLSDPVLSLTIFLGWDFEPHQPDILLTEPNVGTDPLRFEILHTPGHSPGSVSFLLPEAGLLFSGDLVFKGSVGRTDLPGGNDNLLQQSISRHFLRLNDQIIVLPGHGPRTTVGEERQNNPYFTERPAAGDA